MDINEKIELHKTKFKDDPLFRKITSENKLDDLLDDPNYFSQLNIENTYSTKHASELLGIIGREQTLLNYMNRDNFKGYLITYKRGRSYRYDWKIIFKFKMIFLLTDQLEFTPSDVASFVGTRVETMSTSDEEPVVRIPGIPPQNALQTDADKTLSNIKLVIEELFRQIHEMTYDKALYAKKTEVDEVEREIRHEEKRLQDLEGYWELMTLSMNTEEQSFFGKLFNKKKTTDSTLMQQKYLDMKKTINDNIAELEVKKNQLAEDQKQLENTSVEKYMLQQKERDKNEALPNDSEH